MQADNTCMKMDLVLWHEKYNVGITLIDNQHKKLVKIMNKLVFSINEGFKGEDILIIFNEFYDHANYHFKSEEQYFYRLNEIEANLHKLQHKHFIEQLNDTKNSIIENNLSNELLYFLVDWLLVHIQYEDKKLINVYKSKTI
jgi:hemerythrin